MGATIAALGGWREDLGTSAASLPPPPPSQLPASRLGVFHFLLSV